MRTIKVMIIAFNALVTTSFGIAQVNQSTANYLEELQERQAEIDALMLQSDPQDFFSEGGVYSQFVQWSDVWRSRTGINGSYSGFFESQKSAW